MFPFLAIASARLCVLLVGDDDADQPPVLVVEEVALKSD
jgi:hypothetical protein